MRILTWTSLKSLEVTVSWKPDNIDMLRVYGPRHMVYMGYFVHVIWSILIGAIILFKIWPILYQLCNINCIVSEHWNLDHLTERLIPTTKLVNIPIKTIQCKILAIQSILINFKSKFDLQIDSRSVQDAIAQNPGLTWCGQIYF